ncbi:MAG: RsmD family RNA methyltransferase [Candidatus Omnitrophica bacterium]|nr:RsmD family RNA methyltransferase [Candidatus Omnitrophota bacterium]
MKNHKPGQEFFLDLDFGTRRCLVRIGEDEALIDKEITLNLNQDLEDKFCYYLDKEGVTKIAFFSKDTNRYYKLAPTSDWPTFVISSVPMHRKDSPKQDSLNKIEAIKPKGRVLDTCMGPGYTAILASKKAAQVITFEKDPNILSLARINPLSCELFESKNIKIIEKDVSQNLIGFESDYFDCIMHDPPTFTMAKELYSVKFYLSLKRVLKKGSKMFHYTPLYKIKRGYDFPAKVGRNLKTAGFKKITYSKEAMGFICSK